MRLKITVILATVWLLAFSSVNAAQAEKIQGRFIVKFKDSKTATLAKNALTNNSLNKAIKSTLASNTQAELDINNYYIYISDDKTTTLDDAANHIGTDFIESIEYDYKIEFFELPNDELFNHQWYLLNIGQDYYGINKIPGSFNDELVLKNGVSGIDVNLLNYYFGPTLEHTKIVVAIIDSGTDPIHPDLINNLWNNEDEIPDNGFDDDHNGYIDDIIGYDVSGNYFSIIDPEPDNDPTDVFGHGTHVSGLVGAESNNNQGIAGVAPAVELMTLKISPNMSSSIGAEGIIYAVNNGAKIINLSWGGAFDSGILRTAVNFALQNGVAIFASAGNSGINEVFYPAAYDGVITVGAGTSSGYVTTFSTHGNHVDLVAPGLDILSIRATGTDLYQSVEPEVRIIGDDSLYYLADGTSMAAPIAAGAAAFIWSLRPDLNLDQLKNALYSTAIDLTYPLADNGTFLPGKDSISGHGYIDIIAALNSVAPEGIAVISPRQSTRHTNDVPIKVMPVGGYEGIWDLEYTIGSGNTDWQPLASGFELPADSVLYIFSDTTVAGVINLKLIDKNLNEHLTSFTYIRENKAELSRIYDNQSLSYNVPIIGSAYGLDYDSLKLSFLKNSIKQNLFTTSGEFFDSLIYRWTISGLPTGDYQIVLDGFFETNIVSDTIGIILESVFPTGWPISLGARGHLSPVLDDLNNDGVNEIIIGTSKGLNVFHPDGQTVAGFPVLVHSDLRGMPITYDVDYDGEKEIICTDSSGLHVFNYDGTYADGWPVSATTGLAPLGLGYPNPTITKLGIDQDSAIVFLNILGNIMAYKFNGDSYFFSLGGFFSSFNPRLNYSNDVGQSIISYVTSHDFTGDGFYEVLASFSSYNPYSGLGLFNGRSGQPELTETDPLILRTPILTGTAVTDFNQDSLYEIVTLGFDSNYVAKLWVKTHLSEDYPGWPITLNEVISGQMIGTTPTLADLDLDDIPEILFTFMGFDNSYLFIFTSNGIPYSQLEGAPYGVAYIDNNMLSIPIAANLTGDIYPEVIIRSGHFFPGTGPEKIHIFDHFIEPIETSPIFTPASPSHVLSTRYAPVIDDVDSDGLVELMIVSDNSELLLYDFDASYDNGKNKAKFLGDNLNTNSFNPIKIPTDAHDPIDILPKKYQLAQNYPNPFNPQTKIKYDIPNRSSVVLEVFNILGQKVSILVDEEQPAGSYEVEFDANKFSSGVYLYRLKSGDTNLSKKMVLVK